MFENIKQNQATLCADSYFEEKQLFPSMSCTYTSPEQPSVAHG